MATQTPAPPVLETPERAPIPIQEAVWIDPNQPGHIPCFRNTSIPIKTVFEWLANGKTRNDILENFPITPEALTTVLFTSAHLIRDTRQANPSRGRRRMTILPANHTTCRTRSFQ